MKYPLVKDETIRLGALHALGIIDAARSPVLDSIVELTADLFGCPMAFVSLLDKEQQWFKAERGLACGSTPRETAFCNYTILGDDVFIVEDALADRRFADSALVTGAWGIRFYAGMPLREKSGHRLGALCVADIRPRTLSANQLSRLRDLGRLCEAALLAHAEAAAASIAAGYAAEHSRLLWQRNQLLSQVERIGKIGGWELDLKTNIVSWSDEVSRIHGLASGKPCPLEEALAHYPGEWRTLVRDSLARSSQTGEPYDFEAQFITSAGEKKWVRASGECEQQDGIAVRIFGTFQDITAERHAAEALRKAADVDELTGLASRRRFNTMLSAAIAKASRSGEGVALMIIDLDNFKAVNDTRGHGVGDQVLAAIGSRIMAEMGGDCLAARLGGDEFAMIVGGDQSEARLRALATAVLERAKQPIRIGSMHIHIGGTVGIARFPADARTAPRLLKRADLALYSAKQLNRGGFSFYTADMATLFELHSAAADLLQNAMARGHLVPFYQPKFRLCDEAPCGFEALARIVTGDSGIIGPVLFAPALDDHALARRLGDRMLRAVTADMAAWRRRGLDPVSVSLNVCQGDFADGKLASRILTRLAELDLQPCDLTIEVTEQVFLGDHTNLVRDALQRLDAAGVGVELDDFGTGYASLAHLRSFPVSRLKIDRSFIEELGTDEDSDVIVQAVIDLGHNLGCEIIAEGVETVEQKQRLHSMGCDVAQGFLFGAPAGAEQTAGLMEMLRARSADAVQGLSAPPLSA